MKTDQTALHPTMTNLLRCGVGRVWEKPCGAVLNMVQNHIKPHRKCPLLRLKLIYSRPI